MTMAKIMSGNDTDSTNKQVKTPSAKDDVNNCRIEPTAFVATMLCYLSWNWTGVWGQRIFFTSVSESNLNALSSRIECGLKIGIYPVAWWA